MRKWTDDPAAFRPMLATTAEAPLDSPDLAYEPKYDGIRALVTVAPGSPPAVRVWSRLGNDKTHQFPDIVDAMKSWGQELDRPILLDGEVVGVGDHDLPLGFQSLQGRLHLKNPSPSALGTRAAFIAFDLLRDGDDDLRPLPLRERRARLVQLLGVSHDSRLRLSEYSAGSGQALYDRAQRQGWEGLIAKRIDAPYQSGRRSPEWRKLKLIRRQVCVIGGWTAPRGSRPFLGALLLGIHDASGRLQYVGHTGAGFTDAELGRVWRRLQAITTKVCPFVPVPKTNERPSWVRPELVAEVKFTEWTADNKLRQPTYIGMRDDVKPESVRKEPDLIVRPTAARKAVHRASANATTSSPSHSTSSAHVHREHAADRKPKAALTKAAVGRLLDQIDEIQERAGSGVLDLPGGDRLDVTNLGKVFWPPDQTGGKRRTESSAGLTKGDLLRHYIRVAPAILPVLAERPLVMKRFPNGVNAKPFYQHRAPDKLPSGIRVETITTEHERRAHLIGGDLKTLLYTAQLASISQDPWFSRVGSLGIIDHVAIDLDPPEGLPFARVLDVARHVREELEILKAPGFPKTSGSGGLHVYIPMPPGTTYDAGLLFCQIVATMVANKHPKVATVERSLAGRGRRIYVDYLQNVRGKTLASAYSARANEFAGVSTPLTWDEIEDDISPRDFTIRNFAARLESVGDLWAGLRKSKGADLRAVTKYQR